MNVKAKVSASLVIGVLVAGVAAGCATKPKMGSGDIVADRQRLMKLNGAQLGGGRRTPGRSRPSR
jgi:hypothetical protein